MLKVAVGTILSVVWLAGCSGEIYLRDGVTDGDTFYLAERAHSNDDPVLQSWVTYSLARSTCKLQIGGSNPARASSYDCELTARRLLAESWSQKQLANPDISDAYLDDLVDIHVAGFLDEYVIRYFKKKDWALPEEYDLRAYRKWARGNIRSHKPVTRIIGAWNYARDVQRL